MGQRIVLAAFAWGALALGVVLNAQDAGAPKTPSDAAQIKENAGLKEQILARQYQEFEQQLLRLKQRLERSSKQEERDQALVLGRVLEHCKEKSISVQFEQMVDILKSKELKSLPDIKQALTRSTNIADELRFVIEMLREDTRAKILQDESKQIKKIIEDLERVIQQQQIVQGVTDRNKTESKELKQMQAKVTQQTAEIAQKLAGKDGADSKKNSKGDPKASGKNGEKAGEAKGDNEKSPSAQAKDGGGDDKEPKGGAKSGDGSEGKDGKGKDGGEGQAKDGKGKDGGKEGGEGQAKGGKEGKDGENKDGKGSDGAQAKDGGKSGENPKGGEPKAGGKEGGKGGDPAQAKDGGAKKGGAEGKGGDGKGQAKEGKGGEAQAKGGDGKGGEGKDGKGGEGKGGEGKAGKGQAKSGESSKGQSQAKSNGEQSPQGPQGPQGQAKDGGQKKGGPQPGPQDSNAKVGKKQVEEGYEKQQDAEAKIEEKKNDDASADQGKAIDKLEQAKKELEKLLRQLREEELERILAALQARCEKMLAMQKQVLAGTETVAKAVDGNADKQPNRENKQDSLKLSDNEGDIVVEATKAIDILEAEGSAIAFPEVFQQVREDMKHVQRRLGVSDSGKLTQEIERDIIASLGEMIEALKKARKENADSKSGESKPGQPPPAQDQKLLEQIAELKMIRSLQIRVNTRTQTYGKLYQGEQTVDPNITRELRNLSERQERIFEITNRMAKGDNR